MKRFAVIGLGVFGMRLAANLERMGAEVVAADLDPQKIQEVKDSVSVALVMDSTDEDALREQGIDQMDAAVVCIGEHFEANVLTTVHLKNMGVGLVIARAAEGIQSQILTRVGADRVVHPEEEIAERLSRQLCQQSIVDYVRISSSFHAAELAAPRPFWGKTLFEIQLRKKFGINLIAVSRADNKGKEEQVPGGDTRVEEGDRLIVVGRQEDIEYLANVG